MKKTLLLFSFVFLSVCGFAQSVSFGVKGGISWAYQELYNGVNYQDFSTSPLTTFSVGGFVDIRKGDFSLQPGLFLSGQGSETKYRYVPPVSNPSSYTTSETKTKLWYAEIPADFVYHQAVPFGEIYLGAGPYISIGVSGKLTDIATTIYPNNPAKNTQNTYTSDASFGPDGNERAYLGGNVMAGVELKSGFLFNLGYNHSLMSINRSETEYQGIKDNEFMISIGYGFK